MALFHTTVLDNQIKALPTVGTASGSIATFDTDLTENLVEVKCQIVATQSGSGTPSPSNPRPITTYTSLNLSHSGSDTNNPTVYNIPFGQTVAGGLIDITTGKLRVTDVDVDLGSLSWTQVASGLFRTPIMSGVKTAFSPSWLCEVLAIGTTTDYSGWQNRNNQIGFLSTYEHIIAVASDYTSASDFTSAVSGKKLVYKLATPYDIQLDSITLQALLNENNIWCDTGDTEVKFLLTVGKKIS